MAHLLHVFTVFAFVFLLSWLCWRFNDLRRQSLTCCHCCTIYNIPHACALVVWYHFPCLSWQRARLHINNTGSACTPTVVWPQTAFPQRRRAVRASGPFIACLLASALLLLLGGGVSQLSYTCVWFVVLLVVVVLCVSVLSHSSTSVRRGGGGCVVFGGFLDGDTLWRSRHEYLGIPVSGQNILYTAIISHDKIHDTCTSEMVVSIQSWTTYTQRFTYHAAGVANNCCGKFSLAPAYK